MHIVSYQPLGIYPDIPQIGLTDYEFALNFFMDQFTRKFSEKVAFYQFGDIRTPGVSDIDLLLIVEDREWKSARKLAGAIISTSGFLQYLFAHEPLIICKSLVEYLPVMHTLENCKFLQGSWNPIDFLGKNDQNDYLTRLCRHATWNSFIRVAALELNNKEIGLRRSLVLVHNLLSSAYLGNQFLQNPVSIPLVTEEIRSNILSTALFDQEKIIKTYIIQVFDILNAIDICLDEELLSKYGASLSSFNMIPLSRQRFVMTPLTSQHPNLADHKTWSRIFDNVEIVLAPAYPFFFAAALAKYLDNDIPELNVFKGIGVGQSILNNPEFVIYAESIKKVAGIFKTKRMDYFFPKPFSIKLYNLSPRDRIVQAVRLRLAKHIFSAGKG